MKGTTRAFLAAILLSTAFPLPSAERHRRISLNDYSQKMKAGWIGQIIGVSWGAPTEGKFRTIIPSEKVPPFTEDLINRAFDQDDLYVEMTFLRTLEQYGLDVSIRQAGVDFANSEYPLWVANRAGRSNLRKGIAPPDSSHPYLHKSSGAIDYQIEADYSGLIAPGLPDVAIALGERFGRLINYGDGVYAGQFVGCMYAEAFFEKDILKIIDAGLKCIPPQSMYAGMVRDMLKWRRENPEWEKSWQLANQKYRQDRNYYVSPLDVKYEGALALLGLLYGGGDPDKTIVIAMRGGSDSDCNPSTAAGVLFTSIGLSELPDRYYRRLDETKVFNHTAYNFPALMVVSEKLARQALVQAGGRIEKNEHGDEVFVVPIKEPAVSKFDDIKNPGALAGSQYSPAERARITRQDPPPRAK